MAIHVSPVDERDNTWEDGSPRFRVYLHGSEDDSTRGWTDTYDVTGADILQVIDWAQRQAGDTLTYAVALVSHDPHQERRCTRPGLIWLVGMDGNDVTINDHEDDVQRRMLARRAAPVGVPAVDRMPARVPDPYNDGTRRR
ncbi:MAG: hypothetical protein ACI379_14315 [Nocardioides sp.]|uniref:hypothetical protein n=1 Tax=Nocardioides sp. TaxID=35761 RepID=UPI003F0B25FD